MPESKGIERRRKNGWSTGCRTTNAEIEERVDEVAVLLCQGITRSKIRKFIVEKHSVSWRTVDNYITRAKKALLDAANDTKPDMVARALAFYEGIKTNPKATIADRLRAQENIDELFGLKTHRGPEVGIVVNTKQDDKAEDRVIFYLPQKDADEPTIDVESKTETHEPTDTPTTGAVQSSSGGITQ